MTMLSDAREKWRAASTASTGFLGKLFGRVARPVMPEGFRGSAEQFEQLIQRGLVVWGAVAQANVLLHTIGGGDAPANVVVSEDATLDERPEFLVSVAKAVFTLKNTTPDDPDLMEIATTISDESNAVAKLRVPTKLTDGLQVFLTSTFVNRCCLPGRVLAGHFFPILIDRDDYENNCVLPAEFWPAKLAAEWRQAARAAPKLDDVPAAKKMQIARDESLAEMRHAAERGELIRITAAAVTEIRRFAAQKNIPLAVELRCVSAGGGYRYAFDMTEPSAPSVVSCVVEGIHVLIPDGLSAMLLKGTVVDFVQSGAGGGFKFLNPNMQQGS